jgi:hypothetical protein
MCFTFALPLSPCYCLVLSSLARISLAPLSLHKACSDQSVGWQGFSMTPLTRPFPFPVSTIHIRCCRSNTCAATRACLASARLLSNRCTVAMSCVHHNLSTFCAHISPSLLPHHQHQHHATVVAGGCYNAADHCSHPHTCVVSPLTSSIPSDPALANPLRSRHASCPQIPQQMSQLLVDVHTCSAVPLRGAGQSHC